MFSHNLFQPQVVSALSQVTSLVNALRTGSVHGSASRRNNSTATTSSSRVLDELAVDNRMAANLAESCSLLDIPQKIALSELSPLLSFMGEKTARKPWKESHVSAATFFENKTGFPKSHVLAMSACFSCLGEKKIQSLLKASINDIVSQQQRQFKTDRGITKITPGIGKRSKNMMDNISSIYEKFLPDSSKKKTTHKFKELLEVHTKNPDMQTELRIAFAEGYAADKQKTQSDMKLKIRHFLLPLIVPLVLLLAYQLYSLSSGKAGIGGLSGFRRFEINSEEVQVNFNDVKGADEAKQELQDVVEFLKDPDKFTALGAKLPKGVLLVGPPGIGKTLLARAVAGEAGVPFFQASGSEFDELFVGTGAKRVRQLFMNAKMRAPCVVFIDEIDTVGSKRTSSQIHPYANQTINMLLSEMDGFEPNEGVIVLGATNRRDQLDKALLRAGRFDVEVRVYPPDLKGRKEILELYLGKVKTDPDIDVDKLAMGTTGFTGADLENMVNQAALKAAMDLAPAVNNSHMEFSRDKVLMGPAKKSRIPDEATNMLTANHEAGHSIVAYYNRDATPLHKVTIIPRGMSLGHTSFIADHEVYNKNKSELMAEMDVAMGGRVAEEICYGPDKVTTGAASDFQLATAIASAMVKKYGMSEKVGVRVFDDDDPFDNGLSMLKVNDLSPAIQELVDNEIKRILQESYDRARHVIRSHLTEHKALAKALMKYETLDRHEIKTVIEHGSIQRET